MFFTCSPPSLKSGSTFDRMHKVRLVPLHRAGQYLCTERGVLPHPERGVLPHPERGVLPHPERGVLPHPERGVLPHPERGVLPHPERRVHHTPSGGYITPRAGCICPLVRVGHTHQSWFAETAVHGLKSFGI